MGIFALQSPAGGFLDENLKRFNKRFDDWCVQFDNYEDANIISQSLPKRTSVNIPPQFVKTTFPKSLFPPNM